MIGANTVFIAAAGSGKTTHLVREALKVTHQKVLITTFTESNEAEIRQRIRDINGVHPSNVVVMTWFAFLISHGVKPFQGRLFDFPVRGMQLVSEPSALRYRSNGHPVYWSEGDHFRHHFFDSMSRVYSDKLSKLAMRCNAEWEGAVVDRVCRVFPNIFVDEAQDLAGSDLEILSALFKSPARVILVADPRQVTYLTHHEPKHRKYRNGGLVDYIKERVPKKIHVSVDETTLNVSHRNNSAVCELSSKLYPDISPTSPCSCRCCRGAFPAEAGLHFVRKADYARYLETYRPMQLRHDVTAKGVDERLPVMNFGESKGRGFDHVLLHPTRDMRKWLHDSSHALQPVTRARLYVALTRARYSAAIVADSNTEHAPPGFSVFQ